MRTFVMIAAAFGLTALSATIGAAQSDLPAPPVLPEPLSATSGDPSAPSEASPAAEGALDPEARAVLADLDAQANAHARKEALPKIDLGVGTVVPLDVAGLLLIEGPMRLQASVEVGIMPKPYAYAIDDLLQVFGVYPDTVSKLIRTALKSSLVVRPSLGWRPFPKEGFEISVGYTYLTLGGGLSARDAIEVATDRMLPEGAGNQVPLHSTLHNIHAQLAWRFLIGDHIVLRISLAYLHTLASSTSIDASPRTAAGQRALTEINHRIDDYLGGYYTKYVHAPLLGLTAFYRF